MRYSAQNIYNLIAHEDPRYPGEYCIMNRYTFEVYDDGFSTQEAADDYLDQIIRNVYDHEDDHIVDFVDFVDFEIFDSRLE